MIRPPGLNSLVVNQMFIYRSSPPTMNWQVTTALPHSFETIPHAVFVLLFHSTYFHFFPRATLPLVSAWGSQVPFLLHRVQTKKGIEACTSMGVDHNKIFKGLANMIILGKKLLIFCKQFQPQIFPSHARHWAKAGDREEKQTQSMKVHPMTWMKWVFVTLDSSCLPVPVALSPLFLELHVSLTSFKKSSMISCKE